MPTVTIEEAQARLSELIDDLAPGGEVVITRDSRPVARLLSQPSEQPSPLFGRGKGKIIIVSEDDEHLKDFEEYMS
jgi:prevent-host-death family protein